MAGTALLERGLAAGALRRARHQGRRNPGAPGIDGMTVDDRGDDLRPHGPTIRAAWLGGIDAPQPVRRAGLPKAGGGTRTVGIPTGLDRVLAQALGQG